MGRIEFKLFFDRFYWNILWINLKRLKNHLFWRILLVIINFALFYSTVLPVTRMIIAYIFVIITLSNLLFIYTRIYSESDSIKLLRKLGASKVFVVLDHLTDILLEIIFAAFLFLFIFLFKKTEYNYFILFFYQVLIVSFVTPVISLISIFYLEKNKKDQ